MLGGAFLALPGSYTLTVGKTGYRDLRQTLQVEYGRPLLVRGQLRKLPGLISIETLPSGARLMVDGAAAGLTPVHDLALEPGLRQLRLEAPRHLPLKKALEVVGMGQRQQEKLELDPDWAPVVLRSEPQGAAVVVHGEVLGRTPVSLELQQGEHPLVVSAPGYKQWRLTLQVRAGEPQELPLISMVPADGVLELHSVPPGGTVTVDGRFRGTTPLELSLAANHTHNVRLTLAGYQASGFEVRLKPEEVVKRKVRLQPGYGIVFISSQPADAQLLIDGKPRGPATARLQLSTRPHSIEVRKPGFKPFRTSVLPVSGSSRNLQVVLQPVGASAGGAAPGQGDDQLQYVQPAASITLGASRREPGRRANENLRRVELTRAFYIGRREVTNAEFRRFRPGHDSGSVNGVNLNGDDQPVVNVSWEDAVRYLNWLSAEQGLPAAYTENDGKLSLQRPLNSGYRLPSEAEWAYAARYANGAPAARFPWTGSAFPPPDGQGNYGDVSARGLLPQVIEGYRDSFPATAPAGSFAANALGIYDLDGNVAEWVHDFYTISPAAAGTIAVNPMGPEQGRHHVVRGSGWRDAGLSELRLSYRDYSERPRDDLGFRVARYAR